MKIFHGDALTFPIGQHVNFNKYSMPWDLNELPNMRLLGNLPFNIATPLLFKLLLKVSDKNSIFSCGRVPMTFLFQQEFGERMICPTGFKERTRVYAFRILIYILRFNEKIYFLIFKIAR